MEDEHFRDLDGATGAVVGAYIKLNEAQKRTISDLKDALKLYQAQNDIDRSCIDISTLALSMTIDIVVRWFENGNAQLCDLCQYEQCNGKVNAKCREEIAKTVVANARVYREMHK